MTRRPVTVEPQTRLADAAALMEKHGFRQLPVVSGPDVVGLLADRDVLAGAAGTAERVEQLMRPPVTCSADERGALAAQRMVEHRIGVLPVLQDGKLVGIVSETNLVSAFRDLCRDPGHAAELDRAVEEVMHPADITCAPGDAPAEVLARCTDWRVRHVPVLVDEELVGLLSERELRLALHRGEAPGRVEALMTRGAPTCEPLSSLAEAAAAMLDGRVSTLPVLLQGVLLGTVTRADVVQQYGSVA